MRKRLWVLLCALSATTACAESAKDAVRALRNSIGNTQLVLKNFSGEDRVTATWTGTDFALAPPRWRTMGVLQMNSAKLSGSRLTLHCVRRVVVKDGRDQLVLYPEPSDVQIEIELGNGDPATVLPKIKDDLFFGSLGEAVAAIPKNRSTSVPARLDKSPVPVKAAVASSQPLCDCGVKADAGCAGDNSLSQGIVPPKFLTGNDPTLAGPVKHDSLIGHPSLNAHVTVGLIVDASGHPQQVWVLRPAGMEFDADAANAVLTYVFRPAMCHEKPVSVYLNVDVAF
ncbi:MAG TPA: energy transducer TonB [Acidobacteriaceae bacterium]